MHWAISRVVAPNFAENREKCLRPHVDYLRSQKNILVISGATMAGDSLAPVDRQREDPRTEAGRAFGL